MKLRIACLLMVVTALSAGCSDEATARSDVPVSRAVAAKELPGFPLPASAREIYHFTFAGGMQDLEHHVRFEVDPADLDAAVDALVAWNNRTMSRSLAYPRAALVPAEMPVPRKEFLPMAWWDPRSIRKGYHRGHREGYALRIFVDEGRSRIYVYQND